MLQVEPAFALSCAVTSAARDIRILSFGAEHHPAALALWQNTAGVGLSDADSFEHVARFLARNPGSSFVGLDGDAVVGTILCGHDGRRGLIHHLAVHSDYRRRGLGRALVAAGLSALAQQGIQKCHLLVFRENEPGKAFWRSLGAEERLALSLFSLPTPAG